MAATPEPLIAKWHAEHTAHLRQIRAANSEPLAAWEAESPDVDYDPETDILLVWCGAPQAAVTTDIHHTFFVRVVRDTLQIVGYEIHSLFSAPPLPGLEPLFERARTLARDDAPDPAAAREILRAILAQFPQ